MTTTENEKRELGSLHSKSAPCVRIRHDTHIAEEKKMLVNEQVRFLEKTHDWDYDKKYIFISYYSTVSVVQLKKIP